MYFDGVVNQFGVGIRVILLTPKGDVVLTTKKLAFKVINNEVEYEVCALRMEALAALGVTKDEIFGDSILVINHARGMGTERTTLKAIPEPPATACLNFSKMQIHPSP